MKIEPISNYNSKIYSKEMTKRSISSTFRGVNIGEQIPNLGIAIDRMELFNKFSNKIENCCIIYKKTEQGGIFKLFKNEVEKLSKLSNLLNYSNELKKYNFYTIPEVLNRISFANSEITSLFNELRIAECAYISISNPAEKESLVQKGYIPNDKNQDFYFIEDYYFDNKKGYNTTGKIVAYPLFKALFDNGKKNILTIAYAIGENSYSPAPLYQRVGFKPFKITTAEIEQNLISTAKGKRINPKLKVPMYLPEDSNVCNLLKQYDRLNKINSISKNWF